MINSCIINTSLGHTKITGCEHGIQRILVLNSNDEISKTIPAHLQECVDQLQDYFEGKRKSFHIKLNPIGTFFQKKVWNELLNIPHSKTLSYLTLARKLGDAKAIRAVANANGKNPLWIVIPCHRVIGTDGSLTGYAGGLHRKEWLLNHESEYKQQVLF